MAKLSLDYIEEAAVDIEAFSRFEFMKVVIIVYVLENRKKNHVIAIISDTQKEHQ